MTCCRQKALSPPHQSLLEANLLAHHASLSLASLGVMAPLPGVWPQAGPQDLVHTWTGNRDQDPNKAGRKPAAGGERLFKRNFSKPGDMGSQGQQTVRTT